MRSADFTRSDEGYIFRNTLFSDGSSKLRNFKTNGCGLNERLSETSEMFLPQICLALMALKDRKI